jgi:transporter family protein
MLSSQGVVWIVYAGLSLVSWGLWGLLARISVSTIGWRETVFLSYVGGLLAFLLFLLLGGLRLPHHQTQAIWLVVAILAGALGFIGTPSFYAALDQNPSSIVVVITSLYPLVTVALSALFLGESLTTSKLLGVSLALAALVLLSIDA